MKKARFEMMEVVNGTHGVVMHRGRGYTGIRFRKFCEAESQVVSCVNS